MNFSLATKRCLSGIPWTVVVGLLTALSLLLALGWWAGNQRVKYKDTDMRGKLLGDASQIANTINPDLALRLTFTPADKGTPAFETIREQMTAYGKLVPNRGIYSLARHGGKLYFGPESYGEHDPLASPAGAEYKEPPQEILRLLQIKQPATIGPYTDEYGTFVTALVPVLNPKTAEVIMIVGLDMMATDWQSRLNSVRRGPLLTSLVAFLLLLSCTIAIRRRNRQRAASDLRLKIWIIVPVALAQLVLIATIISYEYQQSREESRHDMGRILNQVKAQWNRNVFSDSQTLRVQVDNILQDPAIQAAWRERDLNTLTTLSEPIFTDLKRQFSITDFNFLDLDQTCFLKAGQPGRRNDRINHTTLRTAIRTGVNAWGIEFNPSGTLALRYVQPWLQDNTLTGYLELGMETAYLSALPAKTGGFANDPGVEIVSLIHKKYTNKDVFKAGKLSSGFLGEWDDYPDLVIAHQTLAELPNELIRRLKTSGGFDDDVFRLSQGERIFDGGVVRLSDVQGYAVADLIVLHNVTTDVAASRSKLLLILSLLPILFAGVIALLWSVIGAAERQLASTFATMEESELSYRRQFADNSTVMMLINPADGAIIDVNAAAVSYYGFSREQMQAMCIFDVNTLSNGEIRAAIDSVMPERGERFEVQHRLADGSVRDVAISASRIQFGNRQLLHTIIYDITERKRAEVGLSVSEANYRQITEISPDLILRIALDGQILFASLSSTHILNIPPEELVERNFLDLVHLDNLNDVLEVFDDVLESPSVHTISSRFLSANDNLIWLETTLKALRDPQTGNVREVFAVARDVTARKQADEEQHLIATITQIAARSEKLDEMLNGILNEVALFLATDNLFLALYDIESDLIRFPYFVDERDPVPADRPMRRGLTEWVLRNNRSLCLSTDRLNELTESREVEVVGTPPLSWLGVPLITKSQAVGVLVIQSYVHENLYDSETERMITTIASHLAHVIERKFAEEKLRESELRYRDLFENAGDLIQIITPEGKVEYANRIWRETLGYREDEIQQLSMTQVLHLECLEKFTSSFRKLSRGEDIGLIKCRFVKRSGELVDVEGHVSANIKDGNILSMRGIFRDVTEQRRLEREVLEAIASTKHLEGIHQVAVTLQHEINNPLTGVLGNAEFMSMLLPHLEQHPIQNDFDSLKAASSTIVSLAKRIANTVEKLKHVYKPILTSHPVDDDSCAQMISLADSEAEYENDRAEDDLMDSDKQN